MFFILGLSGSGLLSPAGSCECLLWTGLSEQIQSPYRLLSGAKGKQYLFLVILIDVRHRAGYWTHFRIVWIFRKYIVFAFFLYRVLKEW